MEISELFTRVRRSRAASAALVVAAAAASAGAHACDDATTSSAPLDYTALLQGVTEDTYAPATSSFATQADALVTSLKALETTADAASLTAAQDAWRSTRRSFRLLDAVHFGPATDLGVVERVDTFPVDAAASASLAAAGSLDGAANDAKGFIALESLLFSTDGDGAALAALADGQKRTLARLLGEDIAAVAHQLADAWTTAAFAAQLEAAGGGSTRYATQRAALDDLVGAIGYAFELVVAVDLANPLGRQNSGRPDQKRVVASVSDNAVTDMLSTLDGIAAAYDGRGFNTLVRVRSAALDDAFRAQLADCKSQLEALPPPFSQAIVYRTAVVLDAYGACKKAKGTWNVEVTSALGATVKPADTDGD